MKNLRIGIITCTAEKLETYFPTAAEPDLRPIEPPYTPDDQLLVNELRRRGHNVRPVIWGGDVKLLSTEFDCLVVRSPWDYMDSEARRRAFLTWIIALDRAGIEVQNPPAIMAWLTDKRYLLDLERAGVAIVPTRYSAPGEAVELTSCFTGSLVLKPAISAAGVGLVSLASRTEAQAFQDTFVRLNRRQGYLIQPLLPEISSAGEWSLVYLGGLLSHAIHKLPAPGNILCHAERGGSLRFADAPDAVRMAGARAVKKMGAAFRQKHPQGRERSHFPLLYLRVDVIQTHNGPLVSECEGVEPELFFRARPGCEKRFADLLAKHQRSSKAS